MYADRLTLRAEAGDARDNMKHVVNMPHDQHGMGTAGVKGVKHSPLASAWWARGGLAYSNEFGTGRRHYPGGK